MSYNELRYWFLVPTSYKYIGVNPDTPMVYDLAAIQYLYGANNQILLTILLRLFSTSTFLGGFPIKMDTTSG